MLLSEIKEREYRFKLALRMGFPIFSLILLLISHRLITNYKSIDTSFYVEILILFLFSIYFIFYIIYKSFDERITEPVSKTFTREYLFKYIQKEITTYKNYTLILISIDNLDHINNRYSIKHGDKVIREFISFIKEYFQEKNIYTFPIGHVKGGDFIVGLKGFKDEYLSLVDMFFLKTQDFIVDDIEVKISGAIEDTNFSDNIEYIVENLFEMQGKKKKFMSEHKQDLNPKIEELFVKNAVKNGLFDIMIQDVFQDRKTVMKECFIRLKTDNSKLIHQKRYTKILDKLGLRFEFDIKVLQEIFKLCDLFKNSTFAISISPTSIRNPAFIHHIKKILNHNTKIVFILSELDYYSQIGKFNDTLLELKNMQIKIAIDRVGSIHTSFLYLRDLNIDIIRFDSFYTKDAKNRDYIEILNGFNIMAHQKGVKTWIKMIESYETLEKIQALDIDYIQGNYISKIKNKEKLQDEIR